MDKIVQHIIVKGKRMAHDDPVFLGFMEAIRKNLETTNSLGVVAFIPWLTNILPRSWLGLNLVDKRKNAIMKFFEVKRLFSCSSTLT